MPGSAVPTGPPPEKCETLGSGTRGTHAWLCYAHGASARDVERRRFLLGGHSTCIWQVGCLGSTSWKNMSSRFPGEFYDSHKLQSLSPHPAVSCMYITRVQGFFFPHFITSKYLKDNKLYNFLTDTLHLTQTHTALSMGENPLN